MEKGKITILETNIVYLAVALLLVTIGGYVQSANIKTGLLITEYILVLLPVVILLKIKNINLKDFLRFNKLRLKHGLIIVAVTILTYFVAAFFNSIVLTILSGFGMNIKPLPIPIANNFKEYISLFFIIAISAGICEEVFFRGLLLRTYEEKYKITGIIITAIMFGVFHFNLQNLFAPIVLGLVFGYLVHITDSIYAGIIGHITNNGFAVTLMYGFNIVSKKLSKYGNITTENAMPNTLQLLVATIIIGFIAVIAGALAYLLIRIIKNDMQNNSFENEGIPDENLLACNNSVHGLIVKEENYTFIKYIPVLIVLVIYIVFAILQFS